MRQASIDRAVAYSLVFLAGALVGRIIAFRQYSMLLWLVVIIPVGAWIINKESD